MFFRNNLGEIKKIVQDFLKKAKFEAVVEGVKQEEDIISVSIRSDEPKILIGQNGQTLSEIQYLIRAIARKKAEDNKYIEVDINGYKENKARYLKEIAQSAADEVFFTKKEKELSSMPAYERRIIHMELSSRKDIVAESAGEEPNRRIIIKPLN